MKSVAKSFYLTSIGTVEAASIATDSPRVEHGVSVPESMRHVSVTAADPDVHNMKLKLRR